MDKGYSVHWKCNQTEIVLWNPHGKKELWTTVKPVKPVKLMEIDGEMFYYKEGWINE